MLQDFKKELGDLNPNYYGMVDQIVCSRGGEVGGGFLVDVFGASSIACGATTGWAKNRIITRRASSWICDNHVGRGPAGRATGARVDDDDRGELISRWSGGAYRVVLYDACLSAASGGTSPSGGGLHGSARRSSTRRLRETTRGASASSARRSPERYPLLTGRT